MSWVLEISPLAVVPDMNMIGKREGYGARSLYRFRPFQLKHRVKEDYRGDKREISVSSVTPCFKSGASHKMAAALTRYPFRNSDCILTPNAS